MPGPSGLFTFVAFPRPSQPRDGEKLNTPRFENTVPYVEWQAHRGLTPSTSRQENVPNTSFAMAASPGPLPPPTQLVGAGMYPVS